jgi:sugar phosphate permease
MRCTSQQLVVFFLTFFGYATLHAMRTSWSYSKELLQGRHHDLYISNHTMGLVDTVFMLSYAIGLAFIGPLGDHYNLRRFISAGYYTCGLAFLVFPACFHFFGIGSVAILIISRVVNGLGESTGMPGSMGILSKWFTGGHQGLILGLWTGCLCFGNISGLISSTIITQYLHLRWEYNFFFNGIMTLIMATLILFFLKKEPYK